MGHKFSKTQSFFVLIVFPSGGGRLCEQSSMDPKHPKIVIGSHGCFHFQNSPAQGLACADLALLRPKFLQKLVMLLIAATCPNHPHLPTSPQPKHHCTSTSGFPGHHGQSHRVQLPWTLPQRRQCRGHNGSIDFRTCWRSLIFFDSSYVFAFFEIYSIV